MAKYEVRYEILVEARTDSFLGSSNSYLNNLKTVVEAFGPGDAQAMVEAQNGGWSKCRIHSVRPL